MPPLVLWDIDGTLIRGSRAALAAFNTALRAVYELHEPPRAIRYGGKTDPEIALEVLALHGIGEDAALAALPTFAARYVALAETALPQLAQEIEVLPGVGAALAALAAMGAAQTLLTGNLEATARLKLRAAGLEDHFAWRWGAFGSDDRVRDRLVAVAEHKARAAGLRFDQTVVIGDTPRDVQCARAGGARAVAVATGQCSLAELADCQPDALLADLSDLAAVRLAVLGAEHGEHLS